MPPKTPVNVDGTPMDYFDAIILEVEDIYREANLPLDFTGYLETINNFTELAFDDFETSYQLAEELFAWSDYVNNLKGLTKKLLLDAETEKITEIAKASVKADDNVILARKKRNALEAFYDLLEAKSNLLNQAFYFCKSTCDWERKSQSNWNGQK